MKTISKIMLGLIVAAGIPAVATAAGHVHASPTAEAKTSESQVPAEPQSDGEIKKIDAAAGKITVKHGRLANLDMAPMTMVFKVKDRAMLAQVKAGDKVKFTAEKMSGALTITALRRADAPSSTPATASTMLADGAMASSATKPVADTKMAAQPQTDGVIKKVDKEAGKITVKHGPLVNLAMPAMTMVFKVKDPSMLEQVKAGDKVKLTIEKINGTFTITALQGG